MLTGTVVRLQAWNTQDLHINCVAVAGDTSVSEPQTLPLWVRLTPAPEVGEMPSRC